MPKFKVGDKVEHITKGACTVISTDNEGEFQVVAQFMHGNVTSVTVDGRERLTEAPSLRLTGRPFNVGDRVVIGGEKGIVDRIVGKTKDTKKLIGTVRIDMGHDSVWLATDGRAWPGTPIIAEHDWDEESETVSEKTEKSINALGEAAKNCGVLGNWPVDDVTVTPEEVQHISEMQEQAKSAIDEVVNVFNIPPQVIGVRNMTESEFLKEQGLMPKYIKMALALEGIEVDLKTADLIREIVDSVNAHGGQYDIDTSCNIRQRIEEKYI